MTHLVNDAADFADEALDGLVAAHGRYVRKVHGGAVRATQTDAGQVAVVIGGGTGHFPAFAGWVGPGLAHGAACGNIFASPSASQVYSVLKAANRGGGILLSFGNYTGDVIHFGQAADRVRAEGIDVRILTVTDDVASAPQADSAKRRGIAGDLAVFKVAGAAAEEGMSLDDVQRVAQRANERTRTMGVAFSGCTLPGADHPLFTVPDGKMSVGLGIHGEPGIADVDLPTADEIALLLVDKVMVETPEDDSRRIAVILNGLGTVKYEELFVAYRMVAELLEQRGYTVVDPEVGEQCTSLDMAGLSLTVMWLDEELERLWLAPCDTPAFRKGAMADRQRVSEEKQDDDEITSIPDSSEVSRALAGRLAGALADVHRMLVDNESYLGGLDEVAGDGDHGIGMVRGARAADESAQASAAAGAGAHTLLLRAGDAWAERAGGTSGALWGMAIGTAARLLDDQSCPSQDVAVRAASEAIDAIASLGGAEVGDKTMVDAAIPFRDTLVASKEKGLGSAWAEAVAAAEKAASGTAEFAARCGRARTHADKSIGTPDPGAVSFAKIVAVLLEHVSDVRIPRTELKESS
jgi:dihydroxyacetone kinase